MSSSPGLNILSTNQLRKRMPILSLLRFLFLTATIVFLSLVIFSGCEKKGPKTTEKANEPITKKSDTDQVEETEKTRDTAKIAAIYWSENESRQIDYAVDELKPQRILQGKRIEIIKIEGSREALGSKLIAQKAVEAGVLAVIVISTSSPSLSMAPVFQEANIPMINAWASNPKLTILGDNIFRVILNDTFQGRVMANFALKDLDAKKSVVLTNSGNVYSTTLAQIFSEYYRQLGGKILWEGLYGGEATDFSSILENVKTLQPDAVFVPGYSRDAGLIIKQARKMGITSIFLGSDTWQDVGKYAGEAVNGSYLTETWHADAAPDKFRKLEKLYKEKYGESVEPLIFDSFAVLFDAVDRAKSLDPAKIRETLASTKNFKGASGNFSFDKNGDLIKSMVILKFEKGATVFVKSVKP